MAYELYFRAKWQALKNANIDIYTVEKTNHYFVFINC